VLGGLFYFTFDKLIERSYAKVGFADAVTGCSVTAGAAAKKAGGGGAGFISRVVALVEMRAVEWLAIMASERPRQVATAMLVRIFIVGYPVVNGRVAPESRGKNG
jgi:DUF917 family protein